MEKHNILREFGRNLRAERSRNHYSQHKLAELANLSDYSHVGKIERGEMNPTLTTIVNLMLALDISFDELLDVSKLKEK